MSTASPPERVVERFLERVDSGEWNMLAATYAINAIVEQPLAKPVPLLLDGREAIAAHFASAARAPLRLRVIDPIIRVTTNPEIIVAEYDYAGEATSTGRRFVAANVQIFRIRDGLIVRSRDFHDHAAFAAALQQ
jgi:ketosteroid isomerase-like protein